MGIFNKIFNKGQNSNYSEVEYKNYKDVVKLLHTEKYREGFYVETLLNGRYILKREEDAKITLAMQNHNEFKNRLKGNNNFSTTSNIVENNYTTNLKKTNQGSKRNNFINSLSN